MREIREYSQEYVSAQLGISQRAYSKIERGDTDVSFSKLNRLAQIFQVSTVDIISLNIFSIGAQGGSKFDSDDFTLLQVYVDQIRHLQKETEFLRQQIKLLSKYLPDE